jgi:hypothetical protein
MHPVAIVVFVRSNSGASGHSAFACASKAVKRNRSLVAQILWAARQCRGSRYPRPRGSWAGGALASPHEPTPQSGKTPRLCDGFLISASGLPRRSSRTMQRERRRARSTATRRAGETVARSSFSGIPIRTAPTARSVMRACLHRATRCRAASAYRAPPGKPARACPPP